MEKDPAMITSESSIIGNSTAWGGEELKTGPY